MDEKRISGSLIGAGLGDALGADTEFLNIDAIRKKYPPGGPIEPPYPALITDDTQMALAVGDALITAERPYTPENLGEHLRRTFIDWYNDPNNNRAPGKTCLEACKVLIEGKTWMEASQISSKGCGANMRVTPVGLLAIDGVTRAKIAQFQAAYTHGHPTGLAAADLTAFVIADLAENGEILSLPHRVRAYAESQREVYHADWLGALWERAIVMTTPQQYIASGWDECLAVLDRLDKALARIDRYVDPCLATGAGWIAEQAFATALLCFLMFPDDPASVIRRAAITSGDSDTIACIAGSFAGAYHGIDAWPPTWVERIEHRDRLLNMSEKLHQINHQLTLY